MVTQDEEAEAFDPLQDEDIMQWGKYKGSTMGAIPDKYLGWLWSEGGFHSFRVRRGSSGQMAEYIERRMNDKRKTLKPEKYPKYLKLDPLQFATQDGKYPAISQ